LKLVLRLFIIFGAAVIVVDFLYHRMTVPPLEVPRVATAVDRSMAPVTVFGPKAGRYTIMMPSVIFVLEPVCRTIIAMVTLGLISPAAVPVKFVNRGFIPFLEVAATVPTTAIHAAIAASFALSPRISGYSQNKTN
jgi:hypothetical protein